MQNSKLSNLPTQFLERLKDIVPPEKLDEVLDSFCHSKPTTFRANTLKTTPEKLQEELNKLGIEVEKADGFKEAFILKNTPFYKLTQTHLYKNGILYVQSLSSMIPPLTLDPKPGEKILDITAAPGSKTTQIAAMMQNSGEIVANDMSSVRLDKLKANLKVQGVTNTKVIHKKAQDLPKIYTNYFDKTLVDAPCSLEGRFQCNNPKTYKDWSIERIHTMAKYQKEILQSAIKATKLGGTIVYSTCTLAPEENEEVVKSANLPAVESIRVFPTRTMEGFFVAKLIKN